MTTENTKETNTLQLRTISSLLNTAKATPKSEVSEEKKMGELHLYIYILWQNCGF